MKAERVSVTAREVKALLGVGDNVAYQILRDVNRYAVEKGVMPFPSGRANKYLFAERYGIPQEAVNAAIEQ